MSMPSIAPAPSTLTGRIKATAALADPNRYGRSDRSAIGRWFWEIDRVLLLMLAVLIGIGLIAVAAASPAAAQRYSGGSVRINELYYFYKQIGWIGASMPVMILISMMSRERARRMALLGAALFFVMLAVVPFVGPEVNGARRWINFGFGQVQPSEFLKPLFVVAMAWLLSFGVGEKKILVFAISAGITGTVAALLMLQPDFGSTIIFVTVWVAMLAVAGLSMRLLGGLAVGGVVGVVLAYFFYPVATVTSTVFCSGRATISRSRTRCGRSPRAVCSGWDRGRGRASSGCPSPTPTISFR